MSRVILLLLLSACATKASPQPEHSGDLPAGATQVAAAEVAALEELCLPLVSGCGCALLCARGLRRVDGQNYEVSHAGQDSRIDVARLARMCFDDDGRRVHTSEGEETAGLTCLDTFEFGVCGGECVPSPVPTCRIIDGSCRAE